MSITTKISLVILASILFASYAKSEKKVVCYFGGWTVYRPDHGKFEIEYIDPFLCTHVMYGFVGLGENSNIKSLDPWQDLPDDYGKNGFRRFTNLKKINPNLKTMVAIGGWNEGSERYSRMLRTPANRKIFVDGAVEFLTKHGFDGLDLDWEYPNQRGGIPEDVQTFSALCRELREEFDKHGFLLSAAVAAAEASFSLSYDIPEISKHLHFINVMAYDFHGAWEDQTGFNAPLQMSEREVGTKFAEWNVVNAIQAWQRYGAPAEKIIVGVPTYGRAFSLKNTDCVNPGCPAPNKGIAGPWTREPGMLGFNEICLQSKRPSAKLFWDEEAMVPWLVEDNQWIGFDNERSIKLKVDFIKENNYGGAMVWSIDTDDFRGSCGGGKYPLISILRNELIGPAPATSPQNPANDEHNTNSTPSSTTTTTGSPPPHNLCKTEGFIRSEVDCHIYYMCVLTAGEFNAVEFRCPDDLYFDLKAHVCNFKNVVECGA